MKINISLFFSVTFLLIATLFNSHLNAAVNNREDYDLAIKNVSVFDSKTKRVVRNQTILIKGDKIAGLTSSSTKVTASQVIEGNGRLVVPGFVDTHTHFLQSSGIQRRINPDQLDSMTIDHYRQLIADQYLPFGVTTIIDMAQPEAWMKSTLEIQKNPRPDFPNLFISGSSIISDLSWDRNPPPHHKKVFSPEDARKKVREYGSMGVKHIKLYWKLNLPEMEAAIDEANKLGITYSAHVDNDIVDIDEARKLGVRNFEHFFTLIPNTIDFSEVRPKTLSKFGFDRGRNIDEFPASLLAYFQVIRDEAALHSKLSGSLKEMGAEGVSISTALTQFATATGNNDRFFSFDFLPPRNMPKLRYTPEQKRKIRDAFPTMMEYMKLAHDSGVSIRIGTDTRYGGSAFLNELRLLQEYGFPCGRCPSDRHPKRGTGDEN